MKREKDKWSSNEPIAGRLKEWNRLIKVIGRDISDSDAYEEVSETAG